MNQSIILNYLTTIKSQYIEEGLIIKALFGSYSRNEADSRSDIDTSIAEQFNKLKQSNETELLSHFEKRHQSRGYL